MDQSPDSLNAQEIKERQEAAQQIQMLEQIAKSHLTKDAFQRYGNLRAANPEFAVRVLMVVAQYLEKTKTSQMDDRQFKSLLKQIVPKKRDINIKRK